MDREPYEDRELPWREPQQQIYDESPYFTATRYEWDRQKLRVPTEGERMPGEQKTEVIASVKKGVIVAAIVVFGTFAFLAANFVGAHDSWGNPDMSRFPSNQPIHFQHHHDFFDHHDHDQDGE